MSAPNANARSVIELTGVTKRFIKTGTETLAHTRADTDTSVRRNMQKQPAADARYFTALDNITLNIYENTCTIIGGANGSGKSLLMFIIAGFTEPTLGTVVCREKCGLIFQDADTQILGETPEEDILFGLKNLKIPKDQREQRLADALKKTGLWEKRRFPARFLSGGEKRRLAAAAVLAMDCPIVIFDEPYANLDYSGVVQVNALIQTLKKEKCTVLLLTHELEKCYALADRFMVLHCGKQVFDGDPEKGLRCKLEQWNIRNPLCAYTKKEDLLWM